MTEEEALGLVDAYVADELSERLQDEFESVLLASEKLESELESSLLLKEGVRSIDDAQEMLRSKASVKRPSTKNLPVIARAAAVALAVTGAFGVGTYVSKTEPHHQLKLSHSRSAVEASRFQFSEGELVELRLSLPAGMPGVSSYEAQLTRGSQRIQSWNDLNEHSKFEERGAVALALSPLAAGIYRLQVLAKPSEMVLLDVELEAVESSR